MTIHIYRHRLYALVCLYEGKVLKLSASMDPDVKESDPKIQELIRRYEQRPKVKK